MKEFKIGNSSEKIAFKIGDDTFYAVAPDKLPGNVLIRYAEQVQSGRLYDANEAFFNRALDKTSAELFNDRLDNSENPINLDTMLAVVEWLMEQYSNLTTKASQLYCITSLGIGAALMAGAQLKDVIHKKLVAEECLT